MASSLKPEQLIPDSLSITGLLKGGARSKAKILKKLGRNWGKPKTWQREKSHRTFRRKVWL